MVDEIAALDLAAIADDAGLDLAAWRRLSSARQRHALLRWLRGELAESPPASLVERLMREALASGPQRRWPVAAGELRSFRGRLQKRAVARWRTPTIEPPMVVDLSRAGLHEIAAWRGTFRVDRVDEGGIAVADRGAPRAARARSRRSLPGRPAPSAAQPEAAIPGKRRRSGAAQRSDRLPRWRAGLRPRARRRRARSRRGWRSAGCAHLAAGLRTPPAVELARDRWLESLSPGAPCRASFIGRSDACRLFPWH